MTIKSMLDDAAPAVRQQFARECALRALRIHAPAALRVAGLPESADALASLADDCDLNAAGKAAWAAETVSWVAAWTAVGDVAWAVEAAARAAALAARAARDVGDAVETAEWAVEAAVWAARDAKVARAAERKWQKTRLRELIAPLHTLEEVIG